MNKSQSPYDSLPHIPEYYDYSNSHNSALYLILTLRPDWRESKDTIEFVRFTDGITNTLLKAVNKLPGLSKAEVDEDAILLRAYGKGTDVLIDRESEYSCKERSLKRMLTTTQKRHGHTAFLPATASHPRSTPGLRTVSFTNSFQAVCAHLLTCDDQMYGVG